MKENWQEQQSKHSPKQSKPPEQPVQPVQPSEEQVQASLLVNYLSRYRKLKEQMDKLSEEMDSLKPSIQVLVEAKGGKYQDEFGYARMITRADSVSYPSDQVDQLVKAWTTSDNDIMKSCGQMLLPMRKPTKGYSYLQIK